MSEKFEVRITLSAEKDLEEIWATIAGDSRKRADDFVLELEKQILTLEHFPGRCFLIPENEILGTAYRQLIYGSYRMLFRIQKKTVYILRILHGARLWDPSVLGSDSVP